MTHPPVSTQLTLDAAIAHAQSLTSAGRVAQAEQVYREILAQAPQAVIAMQNLAVLLHERAPAEALQWLTRALALAPDYADAHHTAGVACEMLGDKEAAIAHYRRALELAPQHTPTHRHLASLVRYHDTAHTDFATLHGLLDQNLTHEQRLHADFALGKMYADCGEHDTAFAHFARANVAVWAQHPFDLSNMRTLVDAMIANFTPDVLSRFQMPQSAAPAPIFIIGMPRSGSTLLDQILVSHPQVCSIGESSLLRQSIERCVGEAGIHVSASSLPGFLAALDTAQRSTLRTRYESARPIDTTCTRVVDKMLSHFLYLGVIVSLYPHARIVHSTRMALDSCVSMYCQYFNSANYYTYDLATLGEYYLLYLRMMTHWREALASHPTAKMLEVSYESLVGTPDAALRELLAFCDLPWHENCAAFNQTQRTVATASNWQVRQPLYHSSIGRWRAYAAHLGPLLERLDPAQHG